MKRTNRLIFTTSITAIGATALLTACSAKSNNQAAVTTAATPVASATQSQAPVAVASSAPSKIGNSMSNANLPTVTGALGSAPTIKLPGGTPSANLEISDLVAGNGANVKPNSTVTVQYTLMTWSDGKIADSSWSRKTPATFGLGQVIPGWQEGLQGMKVGGRRLLVVPPSLGYGPNGVGPIKANETLVFVVDLLAVA